MAAPPETVRVVDRDAAAAVAGLDALDTPTVTRTPLWRRALGATVPPVLTLVVVIVAWQALWASALFPDPRSA